MKVKELIEALQKMPQDLEVYGVSDHGQIPEQINAPQVVCFGDDTEDYCSEDEAEEYGYEDKSVLL